jgi:hypothetical protein
MGALITSWMTWLVMIPGVDDGGASMNIRGDGRSVLHRLRGARLELASLVCIHPTWQPIL